MQSDLDGTAKGGWGWLVFPVLVMVVGGNLWFGGFFFFTRDVQTAAQQTLSIGPITWSLNQLFLLLIAVRRLRTSGVSILDTLGSPAPTRIDLMQGSLGALAGSAIILTLLNAQGSPVGSPGWPTWVLVYWTLVTSSTAALGEEFYFRAFLFRRFGRFRSRWLLVVTSLAFAAWHLSPIMLLHTFVVGLLFGGIVLKTGRLWPAVLAHAGTNMIGGVGMLAGLW